MLEHAEKESCSDVDDKNCCRSLRDLSGDMLTSLAGGASTSIASVSLHKAPNRRNINERTFDATIITEEIKQVVDYRKHIKGIQRSIEQIPLYIDRVKHAICNITNRDSFSWLTIKHKTEQLKPHLNLYFALTLLWR